MTTLYASAISLVTLLFQLINYSFPDNLDYYFDPSFGAIRWSIAMLVVLFPLYVYLTRVANEKIRNNSEEKENIFRKWLVYLTLFISGTTLVVDLVVLINAFLGGDLTSRFLLKVVAVFVVIGFAFYYYLNDLRGKWEREEKLSKTIALIVSLIVVASIILGFLVVGSPSEQRLLKFDNEKINDLSSITWEIENYYRENNKLPEDLNQIRDDSYAEEIFTDPQSGEPYGYNLVGTDTYELCAEFNLDSSSFNSRAYPIYDWTHNVGENCFKKTINPEILKPIIR